MVSTSSRSVCLCRNRLFILVSRTALFTSDKPTPDQHRSSDTQPPARLSYEIVCVAPDTPLVCRKSELLARYERGKLNASVCLSAYRDNRGEYLSPLHTDNRHLDRRELSQGSAPARDASVIFLESEPKDAANKMRLRLVSLRTKDNWPTRDLTSTEGDFNQGILF